MGGGGERERGGEGRKREERGRGERKREERGRGESRERGGGLGHSQFICTVVTDEIYAYVLYWR